MSIYAIIDDNEPEFFASVGGWDDVLSWVDALDETEFETLVHLSEHGFVNEIQPLVRDITKAQSTSPPPPDVAATLQELLGLLENESGALVISDGMQDETANASTRTEADDA